MIQSYNFPWGRLLATVFSCNVDMSPWHLSSTRDPPDRFMWRATTFVDYEYTIKLDNILGGYIHQLLLLFSMCGSANQLTTKCVERAIRNLDTLRLWDALNNTRVVISASSHNFLYLYVCRIVCQNFCCGASGFSR